jgi:hypothetical protein
MANLFRVNVRHPYEATVVVQEPVKQVVSTSGWLFIVTRTPSYKLTK